MGVKPTIWRVLGLILVLLLASPVRAIEPLPEDLMVQVKTARDLTERLDEPAIGPLLSDAMTWKAGDYSNARIPDYATLMANPGKWRGEAFVVEGLFAGVPKRERLLAPKVGIVGPWDGKAELWTVVVDENKDMVVLVLLTDPPKDLPKGGARIKLPARLYKVWSYKDLNNRSQSALVFVGRSLEVVEAAPTVRKSDSTVVVLTILVFVGFCIALFFARRLRKRFSGQNESDFRDRLRRRVGEDDQGVEALGESGKEEPLPKDPVEALKELERRAGR